MRQLGSLTVVALLMTSAVLGTMVLITGGAQAAWEATGGLVNPASAYPNQTVEVRFDLTNTGTRSMTISKATYEMDWGDKASSVTLEGNMTVGSDEMTELTGSLTVPYIAAGTYSGNVSITARGPLDLFSTPERYPIEIIINEVPPISVAIRASPVSGTVPLNVSLSGSVAGGVGPYTYTWSLGDGSSGSNSSLTHRYDRPGLFNVTLKAEDSLGNIAVANVTINVSAAPLAATIHSTAVNGVAPLATNISATVTGGIGPYTFSWTTGDGGTFVGEEFSHEYSEPGSYTIRLVVTDAEGNTARDLVTIVVLSESENPIGPIVGTPLDIGPVMMAYIFVFVIASVSVVGLMIYRNRTRFRR